MSNKFIAKNYNNEDRKIIKNLLIANEIGSTGLSTSIGMNFKESANIEFNSLVEKSKIEIRESFLDKLKQKFNKSCDSNISFDQLEDILSVLDIKDGIFFYDTEPKNISPKEATMHIKNTPSVIR